MEWGAAAAIDFVGSPASVQFGLSTLRKGGTLVIVGLFGRKLPLSTALVPLQMHRILGSYVGTLAEFRELVELARDGRVKPLRIVARPLSAANAVLDDLRSGKIVGRVVLKP
jgi:alcohol dehydrogenase/propanol-preferring alcohol dehydrogenase